MIPILYAGNEQQFLNNGIGRLADAITCKVTEERNGTFELEMTYPITGLHYEDIEVNRIILAKTEDGGTYQAFIIYKISKPLNGIVTINAEHISYLLNGFVIMPFTATSCADTFSRIAQNIVVSTPFTFGTDIVSNVSFELSSPRSVRALLGGEQGSILDTYGGYDYKFDNFSVYLYEDRGNDNGVVLRYGKNITDLKDVLDTTNIYTGIVPYWANNENGAIVSLPEKVVFSDHANDYPYKIIKTIDFSNDFEEAPTVSQLRQKAENYIASSTGWKIKNTVEVSFVNLSQTEEYKNFAQLERVKLCDTVTIAYDKLGVNVKTKVIKTVYNTLTEKYDSISLGDTTYTLSRALAEAINAPTQTEVSNSIKNAVDHATNLIRGGLGGHVVFNVDGNGEPQEILIMDTDDMQTAVNVIRINLNGIGFSHTGYDGIYDTAWTIDGHFVADFITSGTLNANVIRAGLLQDAAGKNYWNLATGAFSLSADTVIDGETIAEYAEGAASDVLSDWITETYSVDKSTLEGQIDKKAETWYQAADPATVWTTTDDKAEHVGDLWYNTTNNTTWYYEFSNNTYLWKQQNVPDAVFDQIDGKARIFITQPVPPYDVGDLWCTGTSGGILNCITAKTDEQSYDAADWTAKNNYIDSAEVTSQINTYDTNLNQNAVFKKLTNNGAARGIFLQNGELYVNGTYIQANTIAANALTAAAKQELAASHNYISENIFTDISLWEYGDIAPTYETINNKTYLVLDGTSLNAFSTSCYARLYTDAIGAFNFNIHFVYHIDRQVVLADQIRFPFINYYNPSTNTYWTTWKWLPAQTIPADTDFTWDITLGATNVNSIGHPSKFGFYFIPGCKIYLEVLEVTSTLDAYAEAGMTFNQNGLSLMASEIQEAQTHSYLPYDAITNVNRWSRSNPTSGYVLSHETITVDGVTKDAICIDGTNTTWSNEWFALDTDIIGRPQLNVQYKYKFENDFTPSSTQTELSYVRLYSDDNGGSYWAPFPNNLTAGTTYTGGTEYSYNQTATPGHAADYYANKTTLRFYGYINVKIYIYDLSITSSDEVYKKASLSFTSDGLDSVVQNGSVISSINQSAESVKINASQIDLQGDLSLQGDFVAQSSTYSTARAEIKDGTLAIYDGNQRIAGIYPVISGGHSTAWLKFDDENGNTMSYLAGDYLMTEQIVCYDLTVNSTHGGNTRILSSAQFGASGTTETYQFYGDVINSSGGFQFRSDRRKKRSIKDLALKKAKSFIMGLRPVKYKFIKKLSNSDRYHHGLIAQEVRKAMGNDDWGVYCESKKNDFIGLRYDELFADLIKVVQDQEKRIDALERAIHDNTNI